MTIDPVIGVLTYVTTHCHRFVSLDTHKQVLHHRHHRIAKKITSLSVIQIMGIVLSRLTRHFIVGLGNGLHIGGLLGHRCNVLPMCDSPEATLEFSEVSSPVFKLCGPVPSHR